MVIVKKICRQLGVLLLMVSGLSAEVSPEERAALVALYDSTNGDSWTNHSNWKTDDPCTNQWYGVTCSDDNGTVVSIDMYNNHLNGSIPTEIGNLVNLTDLKLGYNQLSGSIPGQIGNLTNLEHLSLQQPTERQYPDGHRQSDKPCWPRSEIQSTQWQYSE